MPVSIHFGPRPMSRTRLRKAQIASHIRGFTLIELMVTLVIIAILAAIAVPSYYRYILRSNRSAAESFMQEIAGSQERYMVDSREFADSLSTLGYSTLPNTVSPSYSVAMVAHASSPSAGTPPNYTITATPIGAQVRDTDCSKLTLNGDGSKSASGTATNCWK